jgi:hypothetical protein
LVAATAHDRRIAAILHEAELSPPQRIPALARPDVRDFEASLPSNIDEARSLLVQQRTKEPGYRQPDQQKRHVFRSKKSKEAKCNTANWVFTKHEVAKAFDELLSRVTLPVPGIAQALLSHASVASVEELWCHFHYPKLEKRMESRSKKPRSSALPKSISSVVLKTKFETLKVALETSSLELLDTLLSSIESVDTVARAFTHARKTTMVSDRRYWIYQHLSDKGIPSDDVSEALLDSLKADDLGDLSFPKLLLEKGASPGYQNGEPFSLALRANSPNSLFAVRLLTQYVVDDSMATVAFDVVRKTPLLKKSVRIEIYRPLLEWNISKPSISQALADSFKGGCPEISVLQLLLAKGADPNKDNGHCFAVAAKTGALAEFQALSKYAKWRVVLKVLLNNFQEEWEIVRWFKVCLEEQPRSGKIDQDELVFQCMSKFPAGTTLLKLLLDQGVSASAKMDHCLCASWKPEPCTALIWALFQKPRIENGVILVLLSRGDAGMLHVYHIVFPHG